MPCCNGRITINNDHLTFEAKKGRIEKQNFTCGGEGWNKNWLSALEAKAGEMKTRCIK